MTVLGYTMKIKAIIWDYDETLIDTRNKNLNVTRLIINEVTRIPIDKFEALLSLENYVKAHRQTANWREFYMKDFGLSENQVDFHIGKISNNGHLMRLHLFEFEDLSWFPNIIRSGMVDYLKFILGGINFYEPITGHLIKGLEKSGQDRFLDLCSGGGGAIIQVQKNLAKEKVGPIDVPIILSDKYPNVLAFEHI